MLCKVNILDDFLNISLVIIVEIKQKIELSLSSY